MFQSFGKRLIIFGKCQSFTLDWGTTICSLIVEVMRYIYIDFEVILWFNFYDTQKNFDFERAISATNI